MNRDEFDDMERRIENWRRVVLGQDGRRHCASAEGMYRRSNESQACRSVLDTLDGWKLEQAWKSMPSAPMRYLLKFHYLYQMPQHGVIRGVVKRTGYAIRRHHFQAELTRAVAAMKKSLDMLASDAHNAEQQFEFLSVKDECGRREAVFARPENAKPAQV